MLVTEVVEHLQKIDVLLDDFRQLNELRRTDADDLLTKFIKEGTITPLSSHEGLFLITSRQMDNFKESLAEFHARIDSTLSQINELSASTRLTSVALHRSNFERDAALKGKAQVETILAQLQQKLAISSTTVSQSSATLPPLSIFKEPQPPVNQQTKLLLSRNNELEGLLRDKDAALQFLQKDLENYHEKIIQLSMSSKSSSSIAESIHEATSNNNITAILRSRIDLLEREVTHLREFKNQALSKVQENIAASFTKISEEIACKSQLFIESDDTTLFNTTANDFSSSSSALYMMNLQKELYTATRANAALREEFDAYKLTKEREITELTNQRMDVQGYTENLQRIIEELTVKVNSNILQAVQSHVIVESLAKDKEKLEADLSVAKANLHLINSRLENNTKESQLIINEVKRELSMKNEILLRFDPTSDVFANQRATIQNLTDSVEEKQRELDAFRITSLADARESKGQIAKLTEENRILLAMCDAKQQEEQQQKQAGDATATPLANSPHPIEAVYRKKYIELLLAHTILSASKEAAAKKHQTDCLKMTHQIKSLQLLLKKTETAKKLKSVPPPHSKRGGNDQREEKSVALHNDYHPLSADIQKLLVDNSQLKLQTFKLSLELEAKTKEVQQMEDFFNPNIGMGRERGNASPDDYSVQSELGAIDIEQDGITLNEHLFIINAITATAMVDNNN